MNSMYRWFIAFELPAIRAPITLTDSGLRRLIPALKTRQKRPGHVSPE
jgi:hypothetical protein